MENHRDLRDIFSTIHSIAVSREMSQTENETPAVCLCGKNHAENDSIMGPTTGRKINQDGEGTSQSQMDGGKKK